MLQYRLPRFLDPSDLILNVLGILDRLFHSNFNFHNLSAASLTSFKSRILVLYLLLLLQFLSLADALLDHLLLLQGATLAQHVLREHDAE